MSSASRLQLPVLRDLNVQFPRGQLVGILGPVGAGKSSLLQALLGQLYKVRGETGDT